MIFSSVPYALCVWVIHLPVPVGAHRLSAVLLEGMYPQVAGVSRRRDVCCHGVVYVIYCYSLVAHVVVGCICGGEVSRCCCRCSERQRVRQQATPCICASAQCWVAVLNRGKVLYAQGKDVWQQGKNCCKQGEKRCKRGKEVKKQGDLASKGENRVGTMKSWKR